MIHGSLFSGIGGFDLAAQWAGIETVWQVENDPFCLKVLKRHFPRAKQYGDIKMIKGGELESVDIISGGFPCQPFSCAGKRRGAADDRYLWPDMLRIISDVRPAWVIAENVAGIVNMELDQVLADLENAGYETTPFIIPACALDAPHIRKRVWVIGHAKIPGTAKECGICKGKGSLAIGNNKKDEYDVADTPSIGCGSCRPGTTGFGGRAGIGTADCHAANHDQSNGHDAGFDSGEVPQFKAAKLSGLHDAPNPKGDAIRTGLCEREPGWERRGRFGHSNKSDIADANEPGPQIREMFGCDIREKQSATFGNPWQEPWSEVATLFCGIFNGLSDWIYRTGGLKKYATLSSKITGQDMPYLWQGIQSESFQWCSGRLNTIQDKENMFTILWQFFSQSKRQDNLPFESATVQKAYLRNLWIEQKLGCSPHGWKYQEQPTEEYSNYLSQLSHEVSLAAKEFSRSYMKNRVDRLRALGNSIVPQVAFQFLKMIKSIEKDYGI